MKPQFESWVTMFETQYSVTPTVESLVLPNFIFDYITLAGGSGDLQKLFSRGDDSDIWFGDLALIYHIQMKLEFYCR